MTLDPTKDEKFSVFNNDDRQFLAHIFADHPTIAQAFDRYLAMPPVMRYRTAKVELMDVARTGWVIKGIPEPETIYEHLQGLRGLVPQFCARGLSHLDRTTAMRQQRRMEGMAEVHDIPEAIVGDITPQDHEKKKIKGPDKERAEYLAAQVIFADHPGLMLLYDEFHHQQTLAAKLMHDLDKIHAVIGAAYYEAKYPEKTNLWPEFYPYAQSKMKTDQGRSFLEEIASNKAAHIEQFRNPPVAKPAAGRG